MERLTIGAILRTIERFKDEDQECRDCAFECNAAEPCLLAEAKRMLRAYCYGAAEAEEFIVWYMQGAEYRSGKG